jgi:hypothetical protein
MQERAHHRRTPSPFDMFNIRKKERDREKETVTVVV